MFKIVNATIDDIPLIRELTFQVWPQTYAEVITKEQISYMLDMMYSETSLKRQMTEEHCRFLFIYEDEKPAGFASYSEIEPGTFKLHKIYILPGGQGKGKGRFMIDHILNEIKTKKGKALQLQVNRENKARWFYEKLGFSIIREIDLDIGNGFFMTDYIMEKKL